jgi:hypothetical protein
MNHMKGWYTNMGRANISDNDCNNWSKMSYACAVRRTTRVQAVRDSVGRAITLRLGLSPHSNKTEVTIPQLKMGA